MYISKILRLDFFLNILPLVNSIDPNGKKLKVCKTSAGKKEDHKKSQSIKNINKLFHFSKTTNWLLKSKK